MKPHEIALPIVMCAGALLVACSARPPEETTAVKIAEVKQHLETVSHARVLLGHQSVGRNVLAGVATLATEAGVPIRIEEVDGAPQDSQPGLFHSNVGRNGDPDSKCEAFARLLSNPARPVYDVAAMKFCYTDLAQNTPLATNLMLASYDALVDEIRTQRPDVRLMHVTLPLMAAPSAWKTPIKRLIGREVPEDVDNALRNAFNDGLRERYVGDPLFDLAAIESTLPDGSRSSFSYEGKQVYTLAPQYTDDGGHLNPEAQRLAAAAFLKALAEALANRN